jgi:hypothetical protein
MIYAYQGLADTIMAELQHKYNLRPKNKILATTPPKKILPRGKVYEPAPKDVEIPNTQIKGVDPQNAKTKTVETQKQELKKTPRKKQNKQCKA